MSKSVYVSCPVEVNVLHVLDVIAEIQFQTGQLPNYWDRITKYDNSFVKDADIFVLILPKNKFEYKISDLPTGCKRELKEAIILGKSIYIAYKRSHVNEICIYENNIYSNTITGLAGTADNFKTFATSLSDSKCCKEGDIITIGKYDCKVIICSNGCYINAPVIPNNLIFKQFGLTSKDITESTNKRGSFPFHDSLESLQRTIDMLKTYERVPELKEVDTYDKRLLLLLR